MALLAAARLLVAQVPQLGSILRPILGNSLYERVPDIAFDDDAVEKEPIEDLAIEIGRAPGLHARGRSPGPVSRDDAAAPTERESSSRSTSLRPGGMRLGARPSSSGPVTRIDTPPPPPPAPVVAAEQAAKAADNKGLSEWGATHDDEGWGDEEFE